MGQYGTEAKHEARRRLLIAAERKNLDDVLRWNLIERVIGILEEMN
jgi:hypothetical protein